MRFLNVSATVALAITGCVLASLASPSDVIGQRVRFGDSYVVPGTQSVPPGTAITTQPVITAPPGQLVTPAPGTLQTVPPLPIQTVPGAIVTQPGGTVPLSLQPQTVPPPGAVIIPGNGVGPQSVQPPPYIYPPPGTIVGPGSASNGSWSNSPWAWPNQAWARLRASNAYRLIERPRWRQTFLYRGSGANSLGLNETDLATTFAFPGCCGAPIRISPGFVFHWWDGPDTPATGADLPPRTYSAYLASDIASPWDRQFGGELNFTVGVYSDFNFVNSDSVRFTGVGLGWFRLGNTTTFKLGIEYLDRVKVKLLPAIGFFIYPSPDLKLDIYFPRPKLAMRFPSAGNYEVWGYLGAEYGTGSWSIERIGGLKDQADVNDVRIFLGLESLNLYRITGFFEFGYVFNRDIIYRSDPGTEIPIDDTWMLRAGIAF